MLLPNPIQTQPLVFPGMLSDIFVLLLLYIYVYMNDYVVRYTVYKCM